MNIKQFIELLQTFPQDATVQVLSHSSGYDCYTQGGICRVEDFSIESIWNVSESKGNGWAYGEHYEFTTDSSGQMFLQLGVMDK